MIKKFFACLMCVAFFTGCYDKTDIEDIKSIALICVDRQSVHYCSVAAQDGEKKFDFEIITVDTDNLYYGIDKISEMTGKEISMSHLEAILFSKDIEYSLMKKSVNSLLEGTNTHPKIMTAFFDGNFKTFFESLKVPEYTSISKLTDKVLTNRYSLITKCTAMELSCAVNFEFPGRSVPLIKVSDGQVISNGSFFVNNTGMTYIDETASQMINVIKNKSGSTYVKYDDRYVVVNLKKADINVNKHKADIKLVFEGKSSKNKAEIEQLTDYFLIKYYELKNAGYDVLGFGVLVNRRFADIPERNEFLRGYNGISGWLKQINTDFVVEYEYI